MCCLKLFCKNIKEPKWSLTWLLDSGGAHPKLQVFGVYFALVV